MSERAEEALALADVVLDKVSMVEVLAHTALKVDLRPDADKTKKDMEKQKGYLLEALARKGECTIYYSILYVHVLTRELLSSSLIYVLEGAQSGIINDALIFLLPLLL